MAIDIIDEFGESPVKPNAIWVDPQEAAEQEPEPVDFVLPGMEAGDVGSIVSAGGVGKTMFALQLAVTIAGGPDLLGLESMGWNRTTGLVVYLSAEDRATTLRRRLHAIFRWMKDVNRAEREAVYENLVVGSVVGFSMNVMHPEWRRWIAYVTRGARLVVLDTLRRTHRLDENSSGDMSALLNCLEEICHENSTSMLFLHHTNKYGALNASGAQQAIRGSSVLTDNARFQINLSTMTPEQAKQYEVDEELRRYFVKTTFAKINHCPPIPDRWYRRHEGGVLRPAVLEPPRKQKKGGNAKAKEVDNDSDF